MACAADLSPGPCYGVPPGCVVRNTFLEWQESDGEAEGALASCAAEARGERLLAPVASDSKLRRARSCPEEALVARARGRSWEAPATPAERAARSPRALRRPPELDAEPGAEECATWSGSWTPHSTPGGMAGQRGLNSREGRAQKSGGRVASLVLRGLPYHVTEAEVAAFIEQAGALQALAPARAISLLSNPQGRPSGFAEVLLNKNANFREVQEKLHMQRLGGRYIEALPPRGGKFGGAPASRHGAAKREVWRRPA